MTCLGPYEMFYFFSPYVLLLPNSVFSMSNYLNAYKQFLFILTVALWNVFPPQKFCVVYLNFTGYQMKA